MQPSFPKYGNALSDDSCAGQQRPAAEINEHKSSTSIYQTVSSDTQLGSLFSPGQHGAFQSPPIATGLTMPLPTSYISQHPAQSHNVSHYTFSHQHQHQQHHRTHQAPYKTEATSWPSTSHQPLPSNNSNPSAPYDHFHGGYNRRGNYTHVQQLPPSHAASFTPVPGPVTLPTMRYDNSVPPVAPPLTISENEFGNKTYHDALFSFVADHDHVLQHPHHSPQIPEQRMFGQLLSMANRDTTDGSKGRYQEVDLRWRPGFDRHSGDHVLSQTKPFRRCLDSADQQCYAHHEGYAEKREFSLLVVQQPLRARMCGFGDKDRRPISPPPIVQMVTRNMDGTIVSPKDIDVSFFVLICDCVSEDASHPTNLLVHPVPTPTMPDTGSQSTKLKNLVGQSVASPAKLYSPSGELGIYFIFHDLSLRTEGRFRLVFSLADIGSRFMHAVVSDDTQKGTVLANAISNVFIVYTAKNFPGVIQPTNLSQCFARQGIKIPTRRDTKVKGDQYECKGNS